MLEINQSYPCKVGYYGGKRNTSNIKYIVLHYTGNSKDTALANAKYFHTSINRQASAHYFVDETSIYQSVQDNYVAWSVGGGTQSNHHPLYQICTNSNSISIEMCTSGNSEVSETTENNAIELVKYLMKKYGVDANHVVRHYDVNGKACPSASFRSGNRWSNFVSKLGGKVQEATNTSTPQPSTSGTSCNYQIKVTAQSGLNVRATPSTSGAKVGAIACGTIKTVTKENNGWGFIGNGWISLQYTTRVTSAPSSTSVSYKVKINSSNGVNCRKEPSTTGAKVKAYANGTVLTISKESNGWGYTGEGWIKLEYTSKVSTSSTSSNKPSSGSKALGTYEITASALRVRTGAGTGYRQKKKSELTSDGKKHANANGELLKGTRVTVTQWLNGWAKTPSGWVSGDYIKKV